MYELTQSMESLNVDEIIVYLRKSRSDSPEMSVEDVLKKHEEMIQDYANTHFGSPIPEKNIYREVVSGETIDSRPQVKIVLQKIESPQIKAVLIVEPQRLSRGDLEDCGRLINILRYTNTMVLTLTHSFNLQEEYERKFFEMEITRGNDYLEYTKRILRRGRESSAAKGHYIGSVDPYGYRKIVIKKDGINCHTLEIVPEEANVVKLIHELYAYTPGGIGFTNIAHKLDSMNLKPKKAAHWTPAIISSILCNPLYLGLIRWDTRKVIKYINDGRLEKSRPRSSDAKYYKGLNLSSHRNYMMHAWQGAELIQVSDAIKNYAIHLPVCSTAAPVITLCLLRYIKTIIPFPRSCYATISHTATQNQCFILPF